MPDPDAILLADVARKVAIIDRVARRVSPKCPNGRAMAAGRVC